MCRWGEGRGVTNGEVRKSGVVVVVAQGGTGWGSQTAGGGWAGSGSAVGDFGGGGMCAGHRHVARV